MLNFRGPRTVRRGDRFFETLESILVFTDLYRVGHYAVSRGELVPLYKEGIGVPAKCNQFPLQIMLPVAGPFWAAENHYVIDSCKVDFQDKVADPAGTTIRTGPSISVADMFFCQSLVLFYERHRRWINGQYPRRDFGKWPPLLLFARAMRDAAAHDGGKFNMSDESRDPVVWHHLSFDHTQARAQTKVIGDVLVAGDILLLLFELSDELDRLGAPL